MGNKPSRKKSKTNKQRGSRPKALKRPESVRIIEDENTPKFLLDTNVIFAYLNSNNQFHLEAKTAIEGLKAKKVWFVIPYLVIGEFIAHRNLIMKNKPSIRIALRTLSKFDKSLGNRLVGGTPLDLQIIIDLYRKHTKRRKLTNAGFADFVILAEAEKIKNIRILTCDKKMYDCGSSIFRNKIYYLPSRTKSIKSDYPRLMRDMQNDFT